MGRVKGDYEKCPANIGHFYRKGRVIKGENSEFKSLELRSLENNFHIIGQDHSGNWQHVPP
jgi:hypothetical protein